MFMNEFFRFEKLCTVYNFHNNSFSHFFLISNGATVKKNFFRFAAVGCTILLAVSGTFLLMKSTRPNQEVTLQQSRSFEEAPEDELSAPSIRKCHNRCILIETVTCILEVVVIEESYRKI